MVFYFLANIFTYQLFWCFFFVNDFYLQQWGREGLGLDFVDWRIVGMCSNMWGNFGLFSCLIGMDWGFVWDGPRPIMHFEAMGHATLSPFSCY